MRGQRGTRLVSFSHSFPPGLGVPPKSFFCILVLSKSPVGSRSLEPFPFLPLLSSFCKAWLQERLAWRYISRRLGKGSHSEEGGGHGSRKHLCLDPVTPSIVQGKLHTGQGHLVLLGTANLRAVPLPTSTALLCGGETLWLPSGRGSSLFRLMSWLICLHVHVFPNYTCGSYLKVGGPEGIEEGNSHSQLALHLQTRDNIPLTMGLP